MDSSAPQVDINLFEHESTDNSVINRLIDWAITYGRYIMIGTEVVVLLAFISRFSLDRRLTDLREEISQKQIILEANKDFEQDFRKTQSKLEQTRTLLNTQTREGDILFYIQSLLPPDVHLTEFQLLQNKVELSAEAGTDESFSQFISYLSVQKELKNVKVNNVQKNILKGIEFHITADYGAKTMTQ